MEKINKYGLGSNNKELVVTDKYGNVKSIFQNKITLTTLGSSGPSTFVNNILNIPNYSTALSGYVPNSRTLTINGTTYDLSANRTWNVGTLTAVTASAPLSSSGGTTPNITIPQANISTSGFLSATDWNTFNSKQPAGNYITALSGEATGSGPGTASVTLNNASVTAKVLTGVNVTGGSINASDSILTAFGKLQNQINGLIGSSIYQGTWNALTNTPALTSGVGTRGYYYIVNVAGSTNLDGITDWNVGDWAIFDGTAWQQVDNTDSVTSVNGQTGAVSLTTDNIPEGATNLYFTSLRSRQALSLTTLGTGGLSTYDNTTGVLNIPNYSTALGGYVPYIGATQDVNLGEFGLTAGQLTLDVSPTGTAVVGTTRWNNTIGSSETTLKGGSVILKNGVDLVARVVNKVTPNTTLTKAGYAAVRVSGAQGQRLAVAYAQADSDANSADTIGLVTETIATNQEGFIITVGHLEDINTTGSLQGETWADGDVLYLSPTIPGGLTNVKPNGSTGHIVVIGYVEYAHANHGKIYVKIMNGWELDELHNVYINNPLNNQGLFYETATQLWKNKSIDTALGYTPVPTTRQLTINGTAYDLSADRSWNVGTVTNIAMTVPTGLTVTGSPITSSGTFALGLQSGYSIPTTANQSNWTTAYNRSIVSAAVNYGIASTSLVLTQQNTGTITAGLIAGGATTNDFVFFNGSNLAYTQLNTTAPLSFNGATKTFSISQAGASTNGFLSSTDWNTFNNKQNAITLTTTGSSGAATLIGSTLNIPNYSSALSGYVPTSRQLTINGTSYDLSADRSWSVGTVTSIGVTAGPRIVSEDGPITSSGNITISHGIGQGLDVQTAQDLLNRTEDDGGDFEAFRCLATTLGELGDLSTPLGTFNYRGTVIQNIMLDEFGHILGIGSQTLTTDDIAEGSNLYFTDARARGSISLTTSGTSGAATYNSSTGVLNIPQYQSVITNPVTGTGTANYVARWTSSSNISTGVLYDNGTNVGIATTALGSWAKLQVAGNVALTGNLLSFSDNLAGGSTPAYLEYNYSLGKLIVGSYGPSALGHIVLETGGTEKVRITSTGNVGIGTTTPADKLYVSSSGFNVATFDSSYGQMAISFANNGTTFAQMGSGNSVTPTGASDDLGFGTAGLAKNIIFATGTSYLERMRITSAGALLVGTSSTTNTAAGKIVNLTAGSSTPDLALNGGAWSIASIGAEPALYLSSNIVAATGIPGATQTAKGGIGFEYSSAAAPTDLVLGIFGTPTVASSVRFFNNTERMRITSGGNVGIGNTNPTAKLQVGAEAHPSATGIEVAAGSGGANLIALDSSTNHNWLPFTDGTNYYSAVSHVFRNELHSTDWMKITAAGNVGIGTTAPQTKLTISGANVAYAGQLQIASNNYAQITFYNSAALTPGASNRKASLIYNVGGNTFEIANQITNGHLILQGSDSGGGNVGIGTDSPGDKLVVNGNINSKNTALFFGDGSDNSASVFATGGPVKFFANSSERMRITAGGNVGIGTTAPSEKLQVIGNGRFGATSGNDLGIDIDHGNGISDYGRIRFYQNGANYSTIHSFSQAWQGGTVFNSSSGALNFDAVNGATFGLWYDPDVVFVKGGVSYFKNNVGIGTTSPSQRLHVAGRALVDRFQYTKAIDYSSGDLNSLTTAGFYDGENMSNAPNSGWFYVTVETYSGDNNWIHQTATSFGSGNTANEVYTRVRANGTWGSWKKIAYSADISGTTNYISKFTSANSIGNSLLYDNGTNVGIGTTSPSQKLDVAGKIRLTDDLFLDSTNPTITWGVGTLRFYSNAAAEVRAIIDASGNVGIGTTSPATKLHINYTTGTGLTLSNTVSNLYAEMRLQSANSSAYIFKNSNGYGAYGGINALNLFNEGQIAFHSSTASNIMYLTAAGNVGIGTTSPGAKLHVVGNTYIESGNLFVDTIAGCTTNVVSIAANTNFYVPSGNVGIGTTSPNRTLTVNGLVGVTNGTANTQQFIFSIDGNAAYLSSSYIGSSSYVPMAFETGGAERMRITSGGNVGIGTTTPTYKLDVNGTARFQGNIIASNGQYIGSTPVAIKIPYSSLAIIGSAVSDSQASDGTAAVRYSSSPSNTFFYGPYAALDAGSYVARFRIKFANNSSSSYIGYIDVVGTNIIGNAIELRPNMLPSGGDYYYIDIPFTCSNDSSSYELRWIDWQTGVTDTYLDHVLIVSQSQTNNIYVTNGDSFNIYESQLKRFTILNGSGNVGIGTAAPTYKLDVVGDIRLPENNYLYFGNTSNFIRRDSSNILTVAGFSSVHLTTFGSTRVAVAGSGDVGIGTTSPDVKLHVVGTSFVPTTMKLVHSQAFGTPQTLSLSSNSTGVSSLDLSFANPFAINIGGSEMMRIAANGSVGVGTTAPDTSSIMDLSSRRQGFLPPRMTNSEMNSIGSPATGLIVYDTTNNKVTVYNGSSWVPLH